MPKLNPVDAAWVAAGAPKLNPAAGWEAAGAVDVPPKLNPVEACVLAAGAAPKLKPVEACVVAAGVAPKLKPEEAVGSVRVGADGFAAELPKENPVLAAVVAAAGAAPKLKPVCELAAAGVVPKENPRDMVMQ